MSLNLETLEEELYGLFTMGMKYCYAMEANERQEAERFQQKRHEVIQSILERVNESVENASE